MMTIAQNTKTVPLAVSSLAERPTWLDASVFPFESRYISIEGNRIHYIDEGSGPILLFLHGAPAWSFMYREIIKGLRDRFRCIALDFPGFGLSQPAPDYRFTFIGNSRLVERFIDALELNDVTLFAHDAGGGIGLGVAGRRPGLVKAAVIANTFAWPLDDYPGIRRFIRVVASPFFGFLMMRFNFLTRYFVRNVANGRLSEAERRAYLGPTLERARRGYHHQLFKAILNSREYLVDLEQRLLALDDFPVLLTFADDDPGYKAGWLTRHEALFPRHRSVIIAGSDHFPQEHDPEKIVTSFRSWWDEEIEGL